MASLRVATPSELSSLQTAPLRQLVGGRGNVARVTGATKRLSVPQLPKKVGTQVKQVAKRAPSIPSPAKLSAPKLKVPKVSPSKLPRKPAILKKFQAQDRPLWYPGAKAPAWLDGTMIGDYGFDPLSLGKSPEYLQFDLDSADQNLSQNNFGQLLGARVDRAKAELSGNSFQPYSEVFSINRFRENEVIHGRWAMLAVLGALAVEALTGVTWQDAGKVELVEGSQYLGLPLPFNVATLTVIEVLLIGYIEFQRNAELNPETRLYPGGVYFDPLGLAEDPEKRENLKLAELKHARLAMLAALGFAAQAAATGKGPLDNWATHLADPLHTTIFDTFSSS